MRITTANSAISLVLCTITTFATTLGLVARIKLPLQAHSVNSTRSVTNFRRTEHHTATSRLSPMRTTNRIHGCTGDISIDLYDAQETGTRDPFYFITEDDMYLYPVFHSPATDVLDELRVRTIEDKSLFLLDFIDDEPVYHEQLLCKNIPSATSCDIVIGCTWTDEFCDFEMQG